MPRRDTEDAPEALDFPRACHRFLRKLEANNEREWFAAHRDEYHADVLEPARQFVTAAGARVRRFAPTVTADPRANGQGSISRIQRDVRFTADKTPYRPFLGILLWQGTAARKWDTPGFHMVLVPGRVKLSAGIRVFSPAQLERWRDWCRDPRVHRIVKRLDVAGTTIGGQHYKRTPKGYDADNDQHDALLRHRGLVATHEAKIKVSLCGEEFLKFCVDTWRTLAPLNRWLEQLE
jgi:uncharacterized protein (TIGR02453 family)